MSRIAVFMSLIAGWMMACFGALQASPMTAVVLTPTPTPEITSIFDYDTCAPPCWMGIIPGKSTSEDVERVLQRHHDIISPESIAEELNREENSADSDTNFGTTRTYTFDVIGSDKLGRRNEISSRIEIENNYVNLMVILSHGKITLQEILDTFGMPDIARIYITSSGKIYLYIIYLDTLLRVNIDLPQEKCQTATMVHHGTLDSVLYFSEKKAWSLDTINPKLPQPALTGYWLSGERDIPHDIWEEWIGGADMSCVEAWAALPTPEITPVVDLTPTATPAR